MTFTDEDGHARQFTWRTIQTWYWRWPQRDLAGNTIDFCTQILGLSFHDAMRQITGT